jgi:hypothetical protein
MVIDSGRGVLAAYLDRQLPINSIRLGAEVGTYSAKATRGAVPPVFFLRAK